MLQKANTFAMYFMNGHHHTLQWWIAFNNHRFPPPDEAHRKWLLFSLIYFYFNAISDEKCFRWRFQSYQLLQPLNKWYWPPDRFMLITLLFPLLLVVFRMRWDLFHKYLQFISISSGFLLILFFLLFLLLLLPGLSPKSKSTIRRLYVHHCDFHGNKLAQIAQ